MTILLAIVAVLLVVGVWAVYFRLRALHESIAATYDRDANVFADTVKHLLVMIWMRLAEPSERGRVGQAFNVDQFVVPMILRNAEQHKELVEERDVLCGRTFLDDDGKRRLEQLERSIRFSEGRQTPEDEKSLDDDEKRRLKQIEAETKEEVRYVRGEMSPEESAWYEMKKGIKSKPEPKRKS